MNKRPADPDFHIDMIKASLGTCATFQPEAAIEHDQNADLRKTESEIQHKP